MLFQFVLTKFFKSKMFSCFNFTESSSRDQVMQRAYCAFLPNKHLREKRLCKETKNVCVGGWELEITVLESPQ